MSLLGKIFPASTEARLKHFAQARRTRRWGTGILTFLVVFGLLGFFAAPPLIRGQAEKQLSQLLSRPVSIGKVSLNPYTLTLQLEKLHIGERGGQGDFVDVGRILVRASWSSLFRFKPVVAEAYMDAPQVHVVRTAEQTFNFTDLVEQFSKPAAPQPADSKPTHFYIANIHVDNGLVDFDDRLLNQHHRVEQLMLGIPFLANLPSKSDVFVQPFLKARVDGSPLALEGKVKPFASSLASEVALTLDKLDLAPLMSYAPAKLPVQLPQGRLSTALKLSFAKSGDQSTVALSGTVDLEQLVLNDAAGQPLLKLGALHLDADSVEPLRGIVHLKQLRLDQPDVTLSRDRQGTLNLARLAAQPAAKPDAPEPAPAPPKAAEPAAPFDFGVQNLALNDGRVSFRDDQTGADLALEKLGVSASNLSTVDHKAGQYKASLALASGGTLDSSGNLALADKKLDGQLGLQQLALAAFQPFLASALNGRLAGGTADARLGLKADWSGPAFALQLADGSLSLDGLRLESGAKAAPVISLGHLGADIRLVDLAARRAELSALSLQSLAVNAERAADGSINLLRLAKAGKPAPLRRAKKAPAAREPDWTYAIDEISLDQSSVAFADRSLPQPVALGLAPVQLKLHHFSSDFSKPWQLEAATGFKHKGTLKLDGAVTLKPLKADLKLDGRQMDVAALEPYFTAKLNAYIASMLVNLKGELKLAGDKDQLKVFYKGDAGITNVRMLDKATSDLFAGWGSLSFDQIKAAYKPDGTQVQVGRITLNDFYSRILLNSNGQLNLSDFVVKENAPTTSLTRAKDATAPQPAAPAASAPPAPAAAAAPQEPAASAPPLQLGFGQILLHKGKIDYTDNFIKPNFSAHLVGIEGDIGAFGTQSTEPARVAVQATLSNNGPVAINGTVNPLVKPPSLDMTATTRDVELTNFSAYSVKYAGYPIVKGKLNVDLHYQLDQNKLNANNHIFIDQFTFGDHVDSPTATNLPVRLAISLLKNSRGEIDVNVPVSGSLDDPQFSVGSLIWHAFLNVIEKAVTSPFSLLASAFGGSEELGYVAFEPGSAKLGDTEAKKLDTIAKALTDKPAVKLDISGRVDPAQDTPGLKQAALERMVKQQKIRDVAGKGESVDIDSISVAPAEYGKYLERAYSAADIKKPRNFIGIAKTIPQDQMKQLLLDSTAVSDADLAALAQRRAGVVQEYFNGKVAAGRIYTVAPKMDASGISDKGPSTRVEFTLK
jgi:hypothetical protein